MSEETPVNDPDGVEARIIQLRMRRKIRLRMVTMEVVPNVNFKLLVSCITKI